MEQLDKEREGRIHALRLLAVLVERAGGEVRITREELGHDREISQSEIGITGVLVLKAEKK